MAKTKHKGRGKGRGNAWTAKIDKPQMKHQRYGLTKNEEAIVALNQEAQRRRISYGKLVGLLGPEEKAEIIFRYHKEKAAG